jgi:hypothetical protein
MGLNFAMNRETQGTQHLLYFLELIGAAATPHEVLGAVQCYLKAWPKERVAHLQRVDGGWAPFDDDQRPLEVSTLGHLRCFRDSVHRQCLGLKEAKMQLAPEIMELDEILFIAMQYAESMEAPDFKPRSPAVGTRSRLLNFL